MTHKQAIESYLRSQGTWVYKSHILKQQFGNAMGDTIGRRLRDLVKEDKIEVRKWEYGTQYRLKDFAASLIVVSVSTSQTTLLDVETKKNFA